MRILSAAAGDQISDEMEWEVPAPKTG